MFQEALKLRSSFSRIMPDSLWPPSVVGTCDNVAKIREQCVNRVGNRCPVSRQLRRVALILWDANNRTRKTHK
eukprot:scaffold6186_cov21-Prasinocladus_malaysianus.AAC.1